MTKQTTIVVIGSLRVKLLPYFSLDVAVCIVLSGSTQFRPECLNTRVKMVFLVKRILRQEDTFERFCYLSL